MVIVIGEFRLPLESLIAAREPMERVIAATRAEDGCLSYAYAEDVLDPGLFHISEAWESREMLAAHLKAPHMAVWAQERAELGLSGRKVTLHEVSASEEV